MNARITAIAAAAVLFGVSATAVADHDYRVARNDRAVYDYAKVISSEPMIDYVTITTPVRQCREEMQYYTVDRRARDANGGALVGAIIGGVIGHQFGSGRGNDAATVAGTMIGAAIGSDSARRNSDHYSVERIGRPVQRCSTTYERHREERIDGYRVTYRYRGQTYMTEMPYDPGRKIRVRVDVRPAG